MRQLVFRPAAAADLREIIGYLADSSPQTAERFAQAVQATGLWLANYPGAGHRVNLGSTRPDPRRQFVVRGFRSYLVFYRHTSRQVIIVRVIHGARDLPRVLGSRRSEQGSQNLRPL